MEQIQQMSKLSFSRFTLYYNNIIKCNVLETVYKIIQIIILII